MHYNKFYFLYGIQRSCTNIVENIVGINYSNVLCFNSRYNKHDMYPPLPSGVLSVDLADWITDYDRPVIWCYKPINWWVNSMVKQNRVTNQIAHQQSFLSKSISKEDYDNLDNKELYFKYDCDSWNNGYCYKPRDSTGFLYKEYQKGTKLLDRGMTLHKTYDMYIHIDVLINMYNVYHNIWNNTIHKLAKAKHPFIIINWLDLVKVTGQHETILKIESILGESKRVYVKDTFQDISQTHYIPESKPSMLSGIQNKYALANVTDLSHIHTHL